MKRDYDLLGVAPRLSRRSVLTSSGRFAAAAVFVGSQSFITTCGRRLVPVQGMPEPPLVHYPMPYGQVTLTPGPTLTRAYDEAALLAALQGIVNRDTPRLYVLGMPAPDGSDLDAFWWQRMGELGWSVARRKPYVANSLNELLQMFGHRTRGLVVWDPNVAATANVAAMVAGVLDLLPVAYRPASGGKVSESQSSAEGVSLYTQLRSAGFGVAVWLVNRDGSSMFTGKGTIPGTNLPSSGSAKNDAYRWAQAHYLDRGRCAADHMAYCIDAYWLRHPKVGGGFWKSMLTNHDYFVAKRGFFFDLDPWPDETPIDDPGAKPGTDAATLNGILLSANERTGRRRMINVGGFPPYGSKYSNFGSAGGTHSPVATEWRYAQTLSGYNAFMEADTYMTNGSFIHHFPLKSRYTQSAPPDLASLRARGYVDAAGRVVPKRYFGFYVGDFDSPAFLLRLMPQFWNDPARGAVPLSWAFDPNLSLRAGPAMVWTRQTATANDSFVAGDSGAGYLNPGRLEEPRASGLPSGMDLWATHCNRFYQQWDLQVTGFIIEGNAPAMKTHGLDAYRSFSPGGIIGQKLPKQAVIGGLPVKAMDIGGLPTDVQAAAGVIRNRLFSPAGGIPQFKVARVVWQPPSWYKAVVDDLHAGDAIQGPIEIVDLATLLALMARYESSRTSAPA